MHIPAPNRRATSTAFAFGGVAVLALLLRIPSLYEPRWYRDEGIFASIATSMRHGDTLYADSWDNKPPLIFYTYAVVQGLFGTGMFALHAAASVAVIATLLLVMLIALRLYGLRPAVFAGLAFTLITCTPVFEGNLALTETFLILPSTAAVLLFILALDRDESDRSPWIFGAGLLLGVAANYKQVAVFDALAVGVMIWLTQDRPVKATMVLLAGFVVPHAAFAGYFALGGALGDYWYAVAGSLPLYNDVGVDRSPLLRLLSYVPALVAAGWLVARRRDGEAVDARFFAPMWLAFAFAGATSSTFAFPHYLLQAAPAFALTVVALPHVLPLQATRRVALVVAAGIAIGVGLGQFGPAIYDRHQTHPLAYYRNYFAYTSGDREYQAYERFFDGSGESVRDIVADVRQDGAGTTLYAWSELPWLFAAGDLENPTPYYTSFLGELVPEAKSQVLEDLAQRPPAYVVVSENAYAPFDELDRWLEGRYVLLREQNDWRLYRRATIHGGLRPVMEPALVNSP